MMILSDEHKTTLRRLIGSVVNYQGRSCVVVEVLEEDATLVLEETGRRSALQSDQYGESGRHVAETFTLPLLAEDGTLHPEYCQLGLSACE